MEGPHMTTRKAPTDHLKPANRTSSGSKPFDATALLDEVHAEAQPFILNGEEFLLPAPTAWPDEAFATASLEDPVATSRLILGDDYDRFVKAGGNALFLQRLVEKLHGASMGESSASSSS